MENNTFGSCAKLNNNPCQAMITEWSGFYDKVTLEANGGHPLLEDSKATCPIGGKGCIEITFHGQSAELEGRDIQNTDTILLQAVSPFLDIESALEEIEEQELDAY